MGETLGVLAEESIVLEAEQIVQNAAENYLLPEDERVLTEVDNLAHGRNADGTYDQAVLDSTLQNIFTMVQEGAMRYAITRTHHEVAEIEEDGRRKRTFMWLGKTALQVAESGYQFHHHPAARARVAIEVEEARHNDEAIRPGYARIFISPRMTDVDAPVAVAKRENLYDADGLRMVVGDYENQQNIRGRDMDSLLLRDVPYEAWASYLADGTNNVFNKSIQIEHTGSALDIMSRHKELEAPLENLPNGLLTIIEQVIPYIADEKARQKVQTHLENFYAYDQKTLQEQGMNIAQRWLGFKKSIVESRLTGVAHQTVRTFIKSLESEWDDATTEILAHQTRPDGSIMMSRKLEAIIAKAYANIILTKAAIITGSEDVIKQTDATTASKIYEQEMRTQLLQTQGYDVAELTQSDMDQNQMIASQQFKVGGGCAGEINGGFGGAAKKKSTKDLSDSNENSEGETYETASEVLESTKTEGEVKLKKIRCINCSKESKKELVIKPDRWQCPCCKYAIDICTGKVKNEGLKLDGESRLFAALFALAA